VARWCPSYGAGETDPDKAAKLLKFELAPGAQEAAGARDDAGVRDATA
jgi:endonuclease-3